MRRALVLPLLLCGCEWIETAESVVDHSQQAMNDPARAPELVEEVVAEALECHDVLRPSQIQRVRDVLHDPTFAEVSALVTAPEDLATVISLAGPKVEIAYVVARNLVFLADEASILRVGADGYECGESIALACTAGTKTTTPTCDEAGVVASLTVAFDRCTLDGVVYDGAAAIARVDGDAGAARVDFDALSMDEGEVLQGAVFVRFDQGDAFMASMRADDGMKLVSHGGPASGKSCGEELSLDALAIVVDEHGAAIELSGRKRDDEQSASLRTKGEHLSFTAPRPCACPDPGSMVEVQVPRPLGDPGDEALLEVSWRATDAADACAVVDVKALSWPATCYGLEGAGADCGERALVETTRAVLQALCGTG
jgi:hypothetical protein